PGARLEWSTRSFEQVAGVVALGGEVAFVVRIGGQMVWNALGDVSAGGFERGDLGRVVGQQPHRGDPEQSEHTPGDGEVARFLGQAEASVRLKRVEALILQAVGTQLVD